MPPKSPSSTIVRSSDNHDVDDQLIVRPQHSYLNTPSQLSCAKRLPLSNACWTRACPRPTSLSGATRRAETSRSSLRPPSLPLPPRPDSQGADAGPSSESQQPFRGLLLLLISPGVGFSTDAPSYVRNSVRDLIPLSAYQLFSDTVQLGIPPALRY